MGFQSPLAKAFICGVKCLNKNKIFNILFE